MGRTKRCTPATIAGRRRKARQFLESARAVLDLADDPDDAGDSYVTLCVLAGIAASDVICCTVIGEHAQGDNHADAVALLRRARPTENELVNALDRLLAMKTRASYSDEPVTADQRAQAWRRAERLVIAAGA